MSDTYNEYMEDVDSLLNSDKLDFSYAELEDKKKDELVNICKELELKSSGNKPDLINRILEYQGNNVVTATSTITFVREEEKNAESLRRTTEPAKGTRV